MRSVDLRSDTITKPTPAMRRAMADAEVGDDVFGEDPTVNRLEAMAAEMIGKEAALFTPSGSMANLISELSHCGRGDEMILGDQSHIFFYEQGGSAAVGGIHPRTLPNRPDGTISMDAIAAAVRPDNVHFPRTRLIALENTHNRCNGAPLDAAYMDAVGEKAHALGVKLHVDGARIFNAAAALGVPARRLAEKVDSISFCLSKGLASPVGSMVCGSRDFIVRARRARKILGGGMRQAGVLAAAGIVSLSEMIHRLEEDHDNARRLAEGLAEMKGVRIDPGVVKTNIVFFEITGGDAEKISHALDAEGVRVLPGDPGRMRAVTHYHITSDDIDHALAAMSRVFKNS
ncbi:MAG: low-specificity L-threonine aldolase [Desulfobacterales bacterium]|nr:low-specificity L-threonine aldolase [Desulfobacterales bacterium]